jgi:endonuclease III
VSRLFEVDLADDKVHLRDKALEVHRILCETYECPVPFFSNADPLSQLVSNLLSHRTKNKDSKYAFNTLRETFETWEVVRDAPTAEVEEAIQSTTWPEQKAPRIQHVLHLITERVGRLSLEHLADMSVSEARAWLESLPGVGPKTSAATLLFSSLRMPAMPVDSHHHRVAVRLELVPKKLSLEKAHAWLEALLPKEWTAQQLYDHHEVLMMHGQQCCFDRAPACGRCPVLASCNFGQTLLGEKLMNRSATKNSSAIKATPITSPEPSDRNKDGNKDIDVPMPTPPQPDHDIPNDIPQQDPDVPDETIPIRDPDNGVPTRDPIPDPDIDLPGRDIPEHY